jgi:hypothetical protein
MADATSSVAVESHEYLTSEVILLVIELDKLALMQAHDASAPGPSGQRS